jgi:hypothetical protein
MIPLSKTGRSYGRAHPCGDGLSSASRIEPLRVSPVPASIPCEDEMLLTFAKAKQPFLYSDHFGWSDELCNTWYRLVGQGLVTEAGAKGGSSYHKLSKKGLARVQSLSGAQ